MTEQKRAWAAEKGRAEATLRAALASGKIRPPKKEEDPVSRLLATLDLQLKS